MSVHGVVKLLLSALLGSLLVLHAGGWLPWPFLRQLENIAYDARLNLTLPGTVDHRIVIVNIDERSLRQEGQWPWPRGRLAELVERLFDRYRVAVLGMDMVFAEPDRNAADGAFAALVDSPLGEDARTRAELERLRRELDPDRRFAAALRDRPVVLGYFFDTQAAPGAEMRVGQLPPPSPPFRTWAQIASCRSRRSVTAPICPCCRTAPGGVVFSTVRWWTRMVFSGAFPC